MNIAIPIAEGPPAALAERLREILDDVRVAPPSEKLTAFGRAARDAAREIVGPHYPLREAVDRLWSTAEAHGLVQEFGQNIIQCELAAAFENPTTNDALDTKAIATDARHNPKSRITKASELRMMQFSPIRYVLPGFIPVGFTIFASKPKVGKSWFMLDVSLSVTMPRPTLGNIEAPEGDVLYLALEDSQRRLQSRIDKLLSPFSSEWPSRLEIATEWQRGAEGVAELDRWCERHAQARMIVIDVIEKIRPPDNGSGSKRMYALDYEAIGPLQKVAHARDISIVGITHLRKQEAEDVFDTVSGSLGMTGAADTTLLLQRQAGGITLHAIGRDIEQSEIAVQFNKATCRWTILGTAAEVHRSAERNRVLAALSEAVGPMTPKEIQIAAELGTRNATDLLLSKMVKATEIVRAGHAQYCLPPGQTEQMERSKASDLSGLSGGGEREATMKTLANQQQDDSLSDLSGLSGGE
jgi:RecA-family ATPase